MQGYDHQSMQSGACTALKCCTKTEHLWDRKLVSPYY